MLLPRSVVANSRDKTRPNEPMNHNIIHPQGYANADYDCFYISIGGVKNGGGFWSILPVDTVAQDFQAYLTNFTIDLRDLPFGGELSRLQDRDNHDPDQKNKDAHPPDAR